MDTTEPSFICKPFVDTKNIMINREIQPQQLALQSQSPALRSITSVLGTPTNRIDETWCQVSDESFLEMERQCDFETTIRKGNNTNDNLPTFDETQLFDVDPPSEFWNQTNPSLDKISPDSSQEITPVVWRPSTIIEETSSQMSSMNKGDSVSSTSAVSATSAPVAAIANVAPNEISDDGHKKNLSISSTNSTNSSGSYKSATDILTDSLRVTKRKYKFFEDMENDSTPIASHRRQDNPNNGSNRRFFNNSNSNSPMMRTGVKTPVTLRKLDERKSSEKNCWGDTPKRNNSQFNDTLEAIDFIIEEGKRHEDARNNTTIAPTPLFSCKRTRILNELAAVEMASFSRRGPLIDLMASPNSDNNTTAKKKSEQ